MEGRLGGWTLGMHETSVTVPRHKRLLRALVVGTPYLSRYCTYLHLSDNQNLCNRSICSHMALLLPCVKGGSIRLCGGHPLNPFIVLESMEPEQQTALMTNLEPHRFLVRRYDVLTHCSRDILGAA